VGLMGGGRCQSPVASTIVGSKNLSKIFFASRKSIRFMLKILFSLIFRIFFLSVNFSQYSFYVRIISIV